jgi:hypothetical protein
MTQNFNIDLDNVNFRFLTMNRVKLQLFQVYAPHGGKTERFHMQSDAEGVFKIMGNDVCPEVYRHLESTFNDAIQKLGLVI